MHTYIHSYHSLSGTLRILICCRRCLSFSLFFFFSFLPDPTSLALLQRTGTKRKREKVSRPFLSTAPSIARNNAIYLDGISHPTQPSTSALHPPPTTYHQATTDLLVFLARHQPAATVNQLIDLQSPKVRSSPALLLRCLFRSRITPARSCPASLSSRLTDHPLAYLNICRRCFSPLTIRLTSASRTLGSRSFFLLLLPWLLALHFRLPEHRKRPPEPFSRPAE